MAQPAVPPRRRIGRNRAALVILALGALGAGILAERAAKAPAAPPRLEIGPSWTAIPLDRFRARPYLRLSTEAPVAVRLDGERVMQVSRSLRLTLAPLRRLELRAPRGTVPVTLSGEGP